MKFAIWEHKWSKSKCNFSALFLPIDLFVTISCVIFWCIWSLSFWSVFRKPKICISFYFLTILKWHGWLKFCFIVQAMDADDLVTQWVMASATMVLTWFCRHFRPQHQNCYYTESTVLTTMPDDLYAEFVWSYQESPGRKSTQLTLAALYISWAYFVVPIGGHL